MRLNVITAFLAGAVLTIAAMILMGAGANSRHSPPSLGSPFIADSRLMHCSIMARCYKAMLNGWNQTTHRLGPARTRAD